MESYLALCAQVEAANPNGDDLSGDDLRGNHASSGGLGESGPLKRMFRHASEGSATALDGRGNVALEGSEAAVGIVANIGTPEGSATALVNDVPKG